jgi:hypothetical protein
MAPLTESQIIPRKVKLVVGTKLDFSQLMTNPASISSERALIKLAMQLW